MAKAMIMTRIIDNISQVIVGKQKVIELLTIALFSKSHILFEDVPGVGKTTLIAALAKSIDGQYKRVQFTPDVLPSDITGFNMYNQKEGAFEYHEGSLITNIFLADEINRTPPKTQSALLEAMQERQVTVDGKTYSLPNPFMVCATQNPAEYHGTYPLPESQLDRFMFKASVGYPSFDDEVKMLERLEGENPLNELQAVVTPKEIENASREIVDVYFSKKMKEYCIRLIHATRKHKSIRLGASPRAAISLMEASRTQAYYLGRDFVIPDDVLSLFPYTMNHRVILHQDAVFEELDIQEILQEITEQVEIPAGND